MKRDPSDFIIDIKIKNCFLDIITNFDKYR